MTRPSVEQMLSDISSGDPHSTAGMLQGLVAQESIDSGVYVASIMEVYQQTIDVYGPAQLMYQSTVAALRAGSGETAATSANRHQ